MNHNDICQAPSGPNELSVTELKAKIDQGLTGIIIDVREQWEHDIVNLPQAKLVPLNTFPSIIPELTELGKDHEIIIHCKVGGRSAHAVEFLINEGFTNVYNVIGGMEAWQKL